MYEANGAAEEDDEDEDTFGLALEKVKRMMLELVRLTGISAYG